tara:strand:+ start:4597 stop:5124 length:528 start_codon:yes stop_codon:yes gene_type:complete
MYFTKFPWIYYDLSGNNDHKLVTNLLRRVAVKAKVKSNTVLYDVHDVREGELPEHIAFKIYDDPGLHWIILLINDITNIYDDWPMSTPNFQRFVANKYDDVNGTHHYEITQTSGDTSVKINVGTDNTDYPTASIVTNWEYEEALQDKKRKIRILQPGYVEIFVENFKKLINKSVI